MLCDNCKDVHMKWKASNCEFFQNRVIQLGPQSARREFPLINMKHYRISQVYRHSHRRFGDLAIVAVC